MSFQPGWPRSAWATRDPSGSRRSNRPSGDETITSRPSGSQAVHSGSDATRAITSLRPPRSTATTSPADQSEKYSRSPCQRGDSTKPRPVSSVRTSFILVTTLFKSRHVAGVPIPIRTTSSRIDRIERRDTTERGGCSVRHMAMHSVTHLALRVERLRDAEAFYRGLFAMEVAFREAETPDGWWTLPQSAGWDDAERAGIDLGLVMLYRDGIRLALEAADAVAADGQLSHVGVFVDEDELTRLRARSEEHTSELQSR